MFHNDDASVYQNMDKAHQLNFRRRPMGTIPDLWLICWLYRITWVDFLYSIDPIEVDTWEWSKKNILIITSMPITAIVTVIINLTYYQ